MKNKKILFLTMACIIVVFIVGLIVQNRYEAKQARIDATTMWTNILEKQQFEKIPTAVTNTSLEKNDFTKQTIVKKYTNIFSGIGTKEIKISKPTITNIQDKSFTFTYKADITTALGKIPTKTYKATFVKSGDTYKVKWTPTLIFPSMQHTDKVSYTTLKGERGHINDRDGEPLATTKTIYQMGVVPKYLGTGSEKEKNLQRIEKQFDLPEQLIEQKLKQAWVTDDSFVPLQKVDKKSKKQLQGVQYAETDTRYYPLGEASAHLIGYVGTVTAENMKKNPKLREHDLIGKSGLEATYDDQLREVDGGEISILTESGRIRDVLLHVDPKDGKTITLTIDSRIQKAAYEALEKSAGATVVMHPKTGDLTALVSKPSYDPNLMVRGISTAQYKRYEKDQSLPFLNRFTERYAPGSTLKTIIGAIGFDNGTTTTSETHHIEGLKWQKNSSWGSYYVTRLHDDVTDVSYKDAYIYSDNIFFAKEALQMGEKKLRDGLKKFSFEKDLNLPLSMKQAQISNDKSFHSEILLADTAYGQGEVLMSPIAQIMAYAPFANDGQMAWPKLLLEEKEKTTEAVTTSSAHLVRDALKQVVKNNNGTAHALASLNLPLAAKTGTAEMKAKQGVYDGTENSLLFAFNAEKQHYVLFTIVENHKKTGRTATELAKALIPVLEQ